ncbi:MAG: hypothetical protein IJ930_06080 [Lachnospiraceae bacterium]|nr:hypothetical protein [Lachnospiraceae bacterium]
MLMDRERFDDAVRKCLTLDGRVPLSIGMQNEKTLHAVIKVYKEPDAGFHERPVEGYIADIFKDNEITEIQTANFDALRAKLAAFLPLYRVRIVYPIPHVKWIIWVDPETGHPEKRNRSPKKGCFADAFRELYRIRPFLSDPNLSLELMLIDMEEYRIRDGWGNKGKRGSHRFDRIPLALCDTLTIEHVSDYRQFVPEDLEDTFTSADFAKACGLAKARASTALLLLTELKAVRRTGKRGRAYLYTACDHDIH